MTSKKTLIALQFAYENKSLEENFETLKNLVGQTPKNSIVLAPELCLSGYKYDSMQESADFSEKMMEELKKLSIDRIFALTIIEKIDGKYYNNLKLFHNEKLILSRPKVKLFPLGDEEKYFSTTNVDDIDIVKIDGMKIAILVCYELRFVELWHRLLGADIILVPSFWGKLRKRHFEILTNALAVANQAFVIGANSSDESMASSSCIISPFGDEYRDDTKNIIQNEANFNDIKKMRKYLRVFS